MSRQGLFPSLHLGLPTLADRSRGQYQHTRLALRAGLNVRGTSYDRIPGHSSPLVGVADTAAGPGKDMSQ